MLKIVVSGLLSVLLVACGGGGSGNSENCAGSDAACRQSPATGSGVPSAGDVEPAISPRASVAQQCSIPRPGGVIDPSTGRSYGDSQGSVGTEKLWVRSFINDTYLWYDEVVPQDPSLFVVGATVPFVEPADNSRRSVLLTTDQAAVTTYFNSQRSLQLTGSGQPKDRFHFTIATDDYTRQSTGGIAAGFGFHVALLTNTPPRRALVAYSDPGSAAALSGLSRGAEFVSVNGVPVSSGNAAVLNEGLFSPVIGQRYSFEVRDQGSAATRTVALTAASVASVPVQNVRTLPSPDNDVGYLQFNDHIAAAEGQLRNAINQLKASNNGAGISDLVLDMRYNGGGLLTIASELAYMIAGSSSTAGKVFEKLSFNNKNPFGLTDAQISTPFYTRSQGLSGAAGQELPQLGLARVFVLTGAGTCSASESVMNGLAGAGIQVIQIGATTCGKPYGFLPQDNCGVTYFAIQFKGVNQVGYGDYASGFVPGSGPGSNQFAGCMVADDFTQSLGDPAEARLASALQFRRTGRCAAAAASGVNTAALISASEPTLVRSFARENRLIPGLSIP